MLPSPICLILYFVRYKVLITVIFLTLRKMHKLLFLKYAVIP